MDIFSYDHEELARRIQTGLDRMTVNYLRGHGARVRHDDLDFHGFEHIDLELSFDHHTLAIRQVGPTSSTSVADRAHATSAVSVFESSFDGQPSDTVSTGMLAQWLALLPEGELREPRAQPVIDPTNPFLSDLTERKKDETVNPFQSKQPKPKPDSNPFAAEDSDKKRRAAFDWLAGDDESVR
ncbi:MAG: hypothetical protein ACKVVP_23820 [Chloroflexota bacterium]